MLWTIWVILALWLVLLLLTDVKLHCLNICLLCGVSASLTSHQTYPVSLSHQEISPLSVSHQNFQQRIKFLIDGISECSAGLNNSRKHLKWSCQVSDYSLVLMDSTSTVRIWHFLLQLLSWVRKISVRRFWRASHYRGIKMRDNSESGPPQLWSGWLGVTEQSHRLNITSDGSSLVIILTSGFQITVTRGELSLIVMTPWLLASERKQSV